MIEQSVFLGLEDHCNSPSAKEAAADSLLAAAKRLEFLASLVRESFVHPELAKNAAIVSHIILDEVAHSIEVAVKVSQSGENVDADE